MPLPGLPLDSGDEEMNAENRGRWVAPNGRDWSERHLQLELERGTLQLLIRSPEAYVVRTHEGEELHLVLVSYPTADHSE
ncbi:hypothetical protein HSB1_45410 [Halogranum salarium B-1]|uniref:Uncharacterized protein n=2 Tax=Halogranum rubrum TaxID=553466 RepID=J2Z947_9EURY|nr:hypothetical protein HSB1_45410 [Halogranum salarium B-1]